MRDAIRLCNSAVIHELAAILNARQSDKHFEADVLPRAPLLENVVRIREAMDRLTAASRLADGRGEGVDDLIALAKLVREEFAHIRAHMSRILSAPEPPAAATEHGTHFVDGLGWVVPCSGAAAYVRNISAAAAELATTTDAGREDAINWQAWSESFGVPFSNKVLAMLEATYWNRTPAGGEDGRDGARYRLWRDYSNPLVDALRVEAADLYGEKLDAVIDRAIAAKRGAGSS